MGMCTGKMETGYGNVDQGWNDISNFAFFARYREAPKTLDILWSVQL